MPALFNVFPIQAKPAVLFIGAVLTLESAFLNDLPEEGFIGTTGGEYRRVA